MSAEPPFKLTYGPTGGPVSVGRGRPAAVIFRRMVYFLVPAFDEADTLGLLLYRIRQVMEDVPGDYLAIVLDDGSSDDTAGVAERYAELLPVKILRNARPCGFGPSLDRLVREAVRMSRYPERDIAITLEGDYTWSPEAAPEMVREIEAGADIVIGARSTSERAGEAMPVPRRVGSSIVSTILRSVLPLPGVHDYTSTFRAYRVGTLKDAIGLLQEGLVTTRDGEANVELLLRLGRFHPRFAEVPARCRCDIRLRPSRYAWGRAVWQQLALTGRVERVASIAVR